MSVNNLNPSFSKTKKSLRILSTKSTISQKLKNRKNLKFSSAFVSEHCASFKTTFIFTFLVKILKRFCEFSVNRPYFKKWKSENWFFIRFSTLRAHLSFQYGHFWGAGGSECRWLGQGLNEFCTLPALIGFVPIKDIPCSPSPSPSLEVAKYNTWKMRNVLKRLMNKFSGFYFPSYDRFCT